MYIVLTGTAVAEANGGGKKNRLRRRSVTAAAEASGGKTEGRARRKSIMGWNKLGGADGGGGGGADSKLQIRETYIRTGLDWTGLDWSLWAVV
jgi:hypothetical protein